MKKKDFNARVKAMCDFVKTHPHDNMGDELVKRGISNVFNYAAWCERNFEANLREDYKRITTYTADFSIAEWCVPVEGMRAIADTLKNALVFWRDNIKYFAEIIIVLNMKSWEHAARGNNNYGRMYADLYHEVLSLYFDWFDKDNKQHDEAMEYYYNYID